MNYTMIHFFWGIGV